MTRLVLTTLGLTAVYALTLVSSDPVDWLTGAVLSGALSVYLARRLRLAPAESPASFARRLLRFPAFVGAVLVDVIGGTWDVALRTVHLRGLECPGVVRVPIGERTERGVAVSALATTLSPGSVLLDVDWDHGDMLLHVIDASDPDAVRARLQRFYERYQRPVFP